MELLKKSLWRVPLIALIAGALYVPCCVPLLVDFGMVSPGVIDQGVSALVSGGYLLATLVLGWALFLRRQTRREIFLSASVVVAYALLKWLILMALGTVSGPAAVVFLHLETPLQWTIFPVDLWLALSGREVEPGPVLTAMSLLRCFVPWLFVLFGRKRPQISSDPLPPQT